MLKQSRVPEICVVQDSRRPAECSTFVATLLILPGSCISIIPSMPHVLDASFVACGVLCQTMSLSIRVLERSLQLLSASDVPERFSSSISEVLMKILLGVLFMAVLLEL